MEEARKNWRVGDKCVFTDQGLGLFAGDSSRFKRFLKKIKYSGVHTVTEVKDTSHISATTGQQVKIKRHNDWFDAGWICEPPVILKV